ncbi:hypothetical protein, partial [Bartonella henselae]|uniref:hypothetical protein n=2 Tax=Bartonella henselae TaxID=38323 RepID=UPI001AECE3E9
SLNIREKNSPLENVGIKQKKTNHKPLRHETSQIIQGWKKEFLRPTSDLTREKTSQNSPTFYVSLSIPKKLPSPKKLNSNRSLLKIKMITPIFTAFKSMHTIASPI